jgi:carotenoid cleavage dioxygenase-like enzyme
VKSINVTGWAAEELRGLLLRNKWSPLVQIQEAEHWVKGQQRIIVTYMVARDEAVYADTPIKSLRYANVLCDSRGQFHLTTRA